jgi:hypothetical protein
MPTLAKLNMCANSGGLILLLAVGACWLCGEDAKVRGQQPRPAFVLWGPILAPTKPGPASMPAAPHASPPLLARCKWRRVGAAGSGSMQAGHDLMPPLCWARGGCVGANVAAPTPGTRTCRIARAGMAFGALVTGWQS